MFNCAYKYNLYFFILIFVLFSCAEDDSSTSSPSIDVYVTDQAFINAIKVANNLQDETYLNDRIEFDSELYFGAKRIKRIDFSDYSDKDSKTISIIPEEIGSLNALIEFNFSGNQIDSINSSICDLIDPEDALLEKENIDLSQNNLCDLSKVPSCLISEITFGSQSLDQNCSIAPDPDDYAFLTALSSQNSIDIQLITDKTVWANYFSEIDDIIVQKVQSLDLDNLNLSVLPNSIENLDSLKSLSISGNQLSELPYEISSLENLIFLDVSYNSLTELPSVIGSLSRLKELRVNNNFLTKLRSQIGDLQSLEILKAGFNQITSISSNLSNLTGLSIFWVYENNLSDLSDDLCPIVTSDVDINLSDNCFVSPCTTSSGPENIFTEDECMCSNNGDTYDQGSSICSDADGSPSPTTSNNWLDANFPSCFNFPTIDLTEQKDDCQ